MDKVDDFLKRHMLKADMIDEDEVLSLFLSEMEKGLKGEKSSHAPAPPLTPINWWLIVVTRLEFVISPASRLSLSVTGIFEMLSPLIFSKRETIFSSVSAVTRAGVITVSTGRLLSAEFKMLLARTIPSR